MCYVQKWIMCMDHNINMQTLSDYTIIVLCLVHLGILILFSLVLFVY